MTRRLDPETHAAIKRSFHLTNEKIAALYGVKASTVARMRTYEPMPAKSPTPSGEPYNPQDTTEQTIAASARLRDAVRCMLNIRAKRLGLAKPDWAAFDRVEADRRTAGRI